MNSLLEKSSIRIFANTDSFIMGRRFLGLAPLGEADSYELMLYAFGF